jgi:hypothetical protein
MLLSCTVNVGLKDYTIYSIDPLNDVDFFKMCSAFNFEALFIK